MAYPRIIFKGQHTLKRMLTMQAAVALTTAHVGQLVTLDANGAVIPATAQSPFFGVLRTLNTKDSVCTVDFSGAHEFIATAAVAPGVRVVPGSSTSVVVPTTPANIVSNMVTLTPAAAGQPVQVFFLN